ncbi:MAG: CPBP family intramembrane glutamic endopeptidase [Bacteroidales bacterium]
MAVVYPITGYIQTKHFKKAPAKIRSNKVEWYKKSMLWSWLPSLVIVPAVIISGHSLKELGFVLPSAQINNISSIFFYIALSLSALYFAYNIYCMASFRISESVRSHHAQKTPQFIRSILPTTNKERQMWAMLSITAGITEEILYRGYLFFAIFLLFGEVTLYIPIGLSSLLFAIGHIYQGKEVIKPALAGLFLCLIFYFTGSLYVVIILHIFQDLVAIDLLKEK